MFQALEHLEQDSGMGRRKGHKWKGQKTHLGESSQREILHH